MQEYTYQIAILGRPGAKGDRIKIKLEAALADIGLEKSSYRFLEGDEIALRDPKSATAALFFGYDGAINDPFTDVGNLLADTIPILPIVESLEHYTMNVPPSLRSINGKSCQTEDEETEAVSLILENLSLLRKDRRLFISYRRTESTGVADQLSDSFTEKGFDCFLDTRSVRPSDNFQNELWHRMADSDVVILLDTPGFRTSEWTVAELTQANSTSVQILHLLWPGVSADPYSAFSVFLPLDLADFAYVGSAPDKLSTLTKRAVRRILTAAESLRARAIAARQADLFDSISDAAREVGCTATLQPQRYLTVSQGPHNLALMPTVGVPSSPRLHAFLQALYVDHEGFELFAVYDERGILDDWRGHLDWLSEHLPVKTIENGRLLKWLTQRAAA